MIENLIVLFAKSQDIEKINIQIIRIKVNRTRVA